MTGLIEPALTVALLVMLGLCAVLDAIDTPRAAGFRRQISVANFPLLVAFFLLTAQRLATLAQGV